MYKYSQINQSCGHIFINDIPKLICHMVYLRPDLAEPAAKLEQCLYIELDSDACFKVKTSPMPQVAGFFQSSSASIAHFFDVKVVESRESIRLFGLARTRNNAKNEGRTLKLIEIKTVKSAVAGGNVNCAFVRTSSGATVKFLLDECEFIPKFNLDRMSIPKIPVSKEIRVGSIVTTKYDGDTKFRVREVDISIKSGRIKLNGFAFLENAETGKKGFIRKISDMNLIDQSSPEVKEIKKPTFYSPTTSTGTTLVSGGIILSETWSTNF